MRGIAIIPSKGFKFKYQLSSSVQEDPRKTLMATFSEKRSINSRAFNVWEVFIMYNIVFKLGIFWIIYCLNLSVIS